MTPYVQSRATRTRQAGLGLIELMVVVLISTIMMAGLLSIVYGTRQNFTAQNQIGQLQDNERLAMTLITNVVQSGGYFPDPAVEAVTTALPASGTTWVGGQSLYGVHNGTNDDRIYVRYLAGTNDGVMDCLGATNSSGANQLDVNYLYVNTATNQLICQPTHGGTAGTATVLVTGVTGMTINYGLSGGSTPPSAVQYVPSSAMTSANWASVVSVQIQLNFVPPPTAVGVNNSVFRNMSVNLTRTIDLLNRV